MDNAVHDAVRRLSRRSVAWWRTDTRNGRTRADAIFELVGYLAVLGQQAEGSDGARRPVTPPREDVLVDQLAVVGHDLVLALRDGADEAAAVEATERLQQALDEVDPR